MTIHPIWRIDEIIHRTPYVKIWADFFLGRFKSTVAGLLLMCIMILVLLQKSNLCHFCQINWYSRFHHLLIDTAICQYCVTTLPHCFSLPTWSDSLPDLCLMLCSPLCLCSSLFIGIFFLYQQDCHSFFSSTSSSMTKCCQRVQRSHVAFHWTTISMSGRSIPYYNLSVSSWLIILVAHHSKCICAT